ncbi:MAG TPA: hypothetical protein VFA57_13475 [Pseudolabrys sp.]|nr:hypothetical protein [Pseudolabrys sp.]
MKRIIGVAAIVILREFPGRSAAAESTTAASLSLPFPGRSAA